MVGEEGTDVLRNLAPTWSLAGDEKLLKILQNTHQRIISKCQEVNTSMEEMVTALDDASISLQNVNNKFMALSNSQFIESRVYDDDVDVTRETMPVKETPKSVPLDELTLIKRSLAALESLHSPVTILRDSDTESSDDEQRDRLVFKPKDMYADRPLPYIIGSQAWRSKWHAGLLVEESDTDSSTSRRADRDSEQYSDSEPELGDSANIKTDTLNLPDRTISETSSELPSEQDILPTVIKQSPADIAAELARRLGGHPPKVVDHEPEYSPPKSTVKKIYRPELPVPGTIFSEEPPPIDQYQSDGEYSQEDDIFAELHNNKPFSHTLKEQSRLADDLFGFGNNNAENTETNIIGNIERKNFGHFVKEKIPNPSVTQKTTLLNDEPESDTFVENPQSKPVKNITESEKTGVKKPVGGISLFGTNKGAESIGAAILNRNRRKSSTSGEESGNDDRPHGTIPQTKTTDEVDTNKKEKDIFDDLFAKSDKIQKKDSEKNAINKENKNVKIDLFNDNLFDDIDDIFTSNIVKMPTKEAKNNQKSLFSDEDDLFTDVAITKSFRNEGTSSKDSKKHLFDSDDDLFIEKERTPKNSKNDILSHTRYIQTSTQEEISVRSQYLNDKIESIAKSGVSNNTSESLLDNTNTIKAAEVHNRKTKEIKSIFDSDSNESDTDIFSKIKKPDAEIDFIKPDNTKNPNNSQIENKVIVKRNNWKHEIIENTPNVEVFDDLSKALPETTNKFSSPLLFEDDEANEPFVNTGKITDQEPLNKVSKVIDKIAVRDSNTIYIDKNSGCNIEGNKTIEEYIIPDQIDDAELFRSVKTKREDCIDNNRQENEILANVKQNQLSESIINNIEDVNNMRTKIVQPGDEVILDKPQIEIQDNLNIIVPPVKPNIKNNAFETTTNKLSRERTDKVGKGESASRLVSEESNSDKKDDGSNSTAEDYLKLIKENTVSSAPTGSVSNTTDIFDSLFSEPPAFEKPKEPKKSKNINALYDDDSDDEALFFKKDDAITDDKPEDFTTNGNKDLFGIFHDEPPVIDVDFAPGTSKNDDYSDDVDNTVFSSAQMIKENSKSEQILKTKNAISSKKAEMYDSNGCLFESIAEYDQLSKKDSKEEGKEYYKIEHEKPIHITEQIDKQSDKVTSTKTEKPMKGQQDTYYTNLEQSLLGIDKLEDSELKSVVELKQETIETSKIGKINTKNININVNALLPGSSPNKYTKVQSYGQTISTSNEELGSDKTESLMVKSISFEAEPESEVLDNKLSKQRARIRIKRRPSSRRARHEAARKSGFNFGDDSTDNSSSIDDSLKNTVGNNSISNLTSDTLMVKTQNNLEDDSNSNSRSQSRKNKANTTKIVYILNDEDIFNTNTTQDTNKCNEMHNKSQKTKALNIVDDEVDLFKPKSSVSTITKGIKTLGKAYSNHNENTSSKDHKNERVSSKENITNKSIFEDLGDEELFNKNKNKVAKATMFESDSERELFTGKNKKETAAGPRKGDVVKASLFGDDDDDEDLFGAKKETKKPNASTRSSFTTSKEINKSTEPVIDDPLSILSMND